LTTIICIKNLPPPGICGLQPMALVSNSACIQACIKTRHLPHEKIEFFSWDRSQYLQNIQSRHTPHLLVAFNDLTPPYHTVILSTPLVIVALSLGTMHYASHWWTVWLILTCSIIAFLSSSLTELESWWCAVCYFLSLEKRLFMWQCASSYRVIWPPRY